MNYFAHGRNFLDDPYFLAGTAVPDWLSVVNRRVRVRKRNALEFKDDVDPQVAAVAAGIVQHHHDDHWFHASRAFNELCLQFTILFRDHLAPDESLRPSFLGHILVELLLDAHLIAEQPQHLAAYYRMLSRVSAEVVERAVNRMASRPAEGLARWIPFYLAERFLEDYLDDQRLTYRLNQVLRRVRLAPLPGSFAGLLPAARGRVAERASGLLSPPPGSDSVESA